ncbi:hypothetical protein SAMN02745244_02954 [Tessaracoccus bendigoensis DSM 12906]|uniref:Uncharacterized protein n=1 Tax=Tessaracoccus bendigoensis DSM 12906 TaxID=1123357 RepID=A0A1M6KZS2_9ACTN|nr:DUF6767 domain-containing protein [Tessaracoccus bendigoensis]SHJ64493.1 hypothetical protein SAMN02745244_02954 [Tessaracoccus bendigoensis DSM 12906]
MTAERVPLRRHKPATPRCPLRFGEPCSLCVPGATGPQDCPTVALVMDDEEWRAELAERNRELRSVARG